MTDEQWKSIKYFSPRENWGDPKKVSYTLVKLLDDLRSYIGHPIYVLCGTQGKHTKHSYHYVGKAADVYCDEIDLLDFYLASERFSFGGIGVYPNWAHPGLHLDVRRTKVGARWGFDGKRYVPLDKRFIIEYFCPGGWV